MNRYPCTIFLVFQSGLLGIAGLYGLVGGTFNGQPIPVHDCFIMLQAASFSFFIGLPIMWVLEAIGNHTTKG